MIKVGLSQSTAVCQSPHYDCLQRPKGNFGQTSAACGGVFVLVAVIAALAATGDASFLFTAQENV